MQGKRLWVLFASFWLFSQVHSLIDHFGLSANWENVHYHRSIDLSKSYIKETDLIEIKNTASTPNDEYFFAINDGFFAIPPVSIIAVSLVDKAIEIEPELIAENFYKLNLPFPVAPESTIELRVRYVYTNGITPLPAAIEMGDTHNVLIQVNKYPYSYYKTHEYSLTFTGVSKGQEMDLHLEGFENQDLPELTPEVDQKTLRYGPIIAEINTFTCQPMGFLYEHNRPLTKVTTLERSVWLPASDIDQISLEEYYEITNEAAALSSGFSRVDYMKGRYELTRNHFSLSRLEFPIPAGRPFDDYYYTDKVGVVSTHQIAQNHLILQPRFPLFGGWKYNFTLGWNNKISDFVHKIYDEQDTYIVKVPILNTLRDTHYEDVHLNFYLPENAEFLNVSAPVHFESVEVDNEYSFLDVSKGHVKVSVHFKNLIDDVSKVDALLVYKYSKTDYWTKVFKITGFVFLGLLSYYLLSLIDLSIEKSKVQEVKETEESTK